MMMMQEIEARTEWGGVQLSVVNVQDLRGPFGHNAAEIVSAALCMSEADAVRLVTIWDDPIESQVEYLKSCAVVWDALEESSRLLPLGWFERTFRDAAWSVFVPRCLHAVADAVSVTLVRDLVSEDVVTALLSPWRNYCDTEKAAV